jgi:hypothetical protein
MDSLANGPPSACPKTLSLDIGLIFTMKKTQPGAAVPQVHPLFRWINFKIVMINFLESGFLGKAFAY